MTWKTLIQRLIQRTQRIVVAASLTGAAMASGCTAPVDASTSDVVLVAAKNLAFSYDTTVDQFTHMSCTNMVMANPLPYSGSAYFTYRTGAYNAAGVTLTDAFYSTLKKYPFATQADILSASAANSNTVLQFSLRSRENRQSIKVRSGTSPVAGQDYWNMLSPLGDADTALTYVQNPVGGRVKHLRNGSVGGYNLEGSLYFTEGAVNVQSTRDFIQGIGAGGVGMLAVTYTNGSEFSARSAADVVTGSTVNRTYSVYGRGYVPTFSKPSVTGLYSGYPSNVLSTMTETSLDGSALSPTPSWTCPASLQLRIVRAEDAGVAPGATDCVRKTDTVPMAADLKLVRNTLKVEDWYVDLDHRCIIPKHAGIGCYGTTTDIKYSMGDTCGVDANGFSNCVQYTSTCYRN